MCEHERSVHEVENVELEHVAAQLDGQRQGRQRVLGRERARPAMTHPGEATGRAAELDQPATRLTTTTAQSSESSPPAKERQSSSTA